MACSVFHKSLSLQFRGQDLNLRPPGYEPGELPLLHPGIIASLCRCGCRRGFRSAARMPLEHTRRREFTQLVANHIFGHEQFREILPAVNQEGMADKVRHNCAVARPGLDRLAAAAALLLFHFRQQAFIDIRTFFYGTSHADTSKTGTVYSREPTSKVQ